jgi:site-specific DNA-methyltransferase (adenine-specific)
MIKLYKGDCLIESDKIESGSVDLILTDLPYGTMKGRDYSKQPNQKEGSKTAQDHNWDEKLDTDKIMQIANRILRKNGKMLLFAQQPFTTELINKQTNSLKHCYNLIWEKTDFANCLIINNACANFYEDIIIFQNYSCGNNRIKEYLVEQRNLCYQNGFNDTKLRELCGFSLKGGGRLSHYWGDKYWSIPTLKTYANLQKTGFFKMNYSELIALQNTQSTFNLWEGKKFKSNILKYKKNYDGYHPTQKPVLLLEDLIKTFSNENDLVVDLTMGSGSTMVACKNTNRNGIGIEKDENYFKIAEKRINA